MKHPIFKPIARVVLFLLALLGAGYFYAGFYYPDPFAWVQLPLSSRVIVWGARIGIPVVTLGIVSLLLNRKKKPLKAANIIVLLCSFAFIALISYPFLNFLQHRSFDSDTLTRSYHPYLQLMPIEQHKDALGNRDEFRIFCLGGSTTEFKDSAGRGWPKRLEAYLQAHFANDKIKVYNLGRQWYTSLHTLINYETNLRKYKPDVIIVMHVINDLLHNADFSYFSHGPFREDYGHFYGPINNILTHDRLESGIIATLSRLWYFRPRSVVEQKKFPGLAPFERNLETLIDLAHTDRTQVVLLTQPSLYKDDITAAEKAVLHMLNYEAIGPTEKWSYASARIGFKRYNEKLKEIAVRRDIRLFDLANAIPKDLKFFSDDVHYRDAAFDKVAAFVGDRIVQAGIITK